MNCEVDPVRISGLCEQRFRQLNVILRRFAVSVEMWVHVVNRDVIGDPTHSELSSLENCISVGGRLDGLKNPETVT